MSHVKHLCKLYHCFYCSLLVCTVILSQRNPRTHSTGDTVGTTAGLDIEKRKISCPYQNSDSDHPVRSLDTIPPTPSRRHLAKFRASPQSVHWYTALFSSTALPVTVFCFYKSILTLLCITCSIYVSFRSPSVFYILVHTRCRGFLWVHFITLKHTAQSVGLLWTSGRPVAETSTWQHKHCTRDKHPCPQWDSNPRSQQALGRRPTP
jgi:hypothetical protein